MSRQITRRGFVAGTAVAAGLVGLVGCNGGASDPLAAPAADKYPIDPDGEKVEAKFAIEELRDGWTRATQEGAPTIGAADTAKIIQVDGYAFKDLNGNGKLDLFEDWRQPVDVRAKALAEGLTIEEAAPLLFHGDFSQTGTELTDEQVANIEAGQRAGVLRGGSDGESFANGVAWSNALQSLCEEKNGIPYWNSTDAYRFWDIPSCLTLAATFDPAAVRRAANYLARGWRSVGINCELGPEVDVASNPGYSRFSGCFSDDPALSRDLGAAYADGLQSTYGDAAATDDQGWGAQSVSAMFKHYPGDACCEGGRNSHNATGKYCVYHNDNMGVGLVPYTDGGLKLEGKTGQIAAIMPNYAICHTDDEHYGENVASAYNAYVLGILRDAGWDGVVTTDWQITQDTYFNGAFEGRHFGVDDLTPEERISKGYVAGTDQFGGEFQGEEIPEIIKITQKALGEDKALERYQAAARRLFVAELNLGLFENPYLAQAETKAVWADTEPQEWADGELLPKCVVMLKNKGGIIKSRSSKPKVYVPMQYSPAQEAMDMGPMKREAKPASWALPADEKVLSQYVELVTDTISDSADPDNLTEADIVRADSAALAACDFALIFAEAPETGSGSETKPDGTVTYLPMNLGYAPYTADGPNVRKVSLAGDPLPDGSMENRSYYGNTHPGSQGSLDDILSACTLAGETPVVLAIASGNPMIFSEFEDKVAAILYTPNAYDAAATAKVAAGAIEPSGLLPYDMPANMDTVEAQAEDTPHDFDIYQDSEGNSYGFAFGLNWNGVIDDERTKKYKVAPVLTPQEYDFGSYKGYTTYEG